MRITFVLRAWTLGLVSTPLVDVKSDTFSWYTVIFSLIFARDLFGEFRDRFKIANINIRKHNACVLRY